MNLLDKLEPRAPWIMGTLFALPVLVVLYPPMTDLPLHEAVVSVLRHYHDPRYYPPGLYQYNFGHPNQLFYLIAWPLSYAVGTTWALKLVVAATEVWLYVAAARFARYMGTPQWTALLVGILGYGWMFFWGLLANMIGLAALLAVLPALDAFVAKPTLRGAVISFGALVLLHLSHETVMLCACLMMGLFSLGYGVWSARFAARLAPAVGATGLAVLDVWWTRQMRPPMNMAIPTLFHPLEHKLSVLSGVLFAGYEPYVRNLLAGLAALAILLFGVERWRQRRAEMGPLRGTPARELYLRYRFELFAACLFAAYLASPYTLNGATLFYQRFFPPAYAILAVVVAPQAVAATRWRIPRVVAALVPFGSIAITWPSFIDAHRLTRDFEALVAHVDYGSSSIIVDIGNMPSRLFSQTPLEGHVTAMRGGRSLFDFTRSPIAAAFMNPAYAWDEPYSRLMTKPILIRPEHDCDRFRYIFFHSTERQLIPIATLALVPDARLIEARGEWALYESTHLKYGILERDAPLPYPRPHTLRKRIKDVLRKLNDEPIPPEEPQAPPPGYVGPLLAAPPWVPPAAPHKILNLPSAASLPDEK